MKKFLSIALAIVMMFAICIPAFAADTPTEITRDEPVTVEGKQTGTADVYTKTTDAGGNQVWSYTVEIPADLNIAWGDKAAKNMTYKVESQLLIGATLTVSVAGSGTMKANGTTETLAYTLTGGDAVEFSAVNAADTTAPGVTGGENVKIAITSFDGKPVGEYRDTLTYTVVYDDGTATA